MITLMIKNNDTIMTAKLASLGITSYLEQCAYSKYKILYCKIGLVDDKLLS